jgi:hypothetical protein
MEGEDLHTPAVRPRARQPAHRSRGSPCQLRIGSCSSTSRPSAVRHASVSRPSTGPASVARRAARDESGPGSRPTRCAYSNGSVAITIRVTACSCSHVA